MSHCLMVMLGCLVLIHPSSLQPQSSIQKDTLKILIQGMELTGKALKSQRLQLDEVRRILADGMEATAKQLKNQKQEIDDISRQMSSFEQSRQEIENLKQASEQQAQILAELSASLRVLDENARKDMRSLQAEMEKLYKLQIQVVTTSKKSELIRQNYFEDFSTAQLGSLPEGWLGKGLAVQKQGSQRVLQMREIGTGSATFDIRPISSDYFFECTFNTRGYVNKPRRIEITLQPADGSRPIVVQVTDTYPGCQLLVNGRSYQAPRLRFRDPNTVSIVRKGTELEISVNGEAIHAMSTKHTTLNQVRVSLTNSRDEYGRDDRSTFPTIYSIRIGPSGSS